MTTPEPPATVPATDIAADDSHSWRALLPPLQWLPRYEQKWLTRDAVAGVTLAAYAIPVSLAYATLAGLPPEYGVYCYLVGGLAYALFGSSRQVAMGPTSAISLLVGSTIAGLAVGDPARAAALAALTALLVAAVSLVAWALRLSSLVSFISETLLVGFKAGAALTIAMTQLPKLFGVPGGGDSFFERCRALWLELPSTNVAVFAFGLAALALLAIGERRYPGRPVALGVVAVSIVVLSVTPLGGMGFKTVGVLPAGLPALAIPAVVSSDVDTLLPLAFACFLLAYIEGVSAARALAERHGADVDPRQELFALGAANAVTAVAQGYPVAGGLSQSTVNDQAGAASPLSLVFASGTIALCLLFLTGLLRNLPDVVLAAIVLVALANLVDVAALRRVFALSKMEFATAMVALVGVLMLGILKGVLLAAIVSMLLVIRRVAQPHVARLGRIPRTHRYSDLARHPDNDEVPGVVIVRVESGLFYFNVEHVRTRIREHIAAGGPNLRGVVWDLSTSPYVDIAGAKLLRDVQQELAVRRIAFRVVEAHWSVRELLRKEIGAAIGEVNRRYSVDDVVQEELRLVGPPG